MKKYVIIVLSIIILSSCDDDSPSSNPTTLTGTQWNLYKYTSQSGESGSIANIGPVGEEDYRINFNTDGTISAQDACNLCVGNYSVVADTLDVLEISCTEMACTGGNWISAISGIYTTSITNDTLVVTRYPDFLMELESYYFVAD